MTEQLKTFQLDTEKRQCLINGENVSPTCHYLKLEFNNGEWSLMTVENRSFGAPATHKLPREEL